MKVRVPEMEGRTARWYARQRGSAPQRAGYRRTAAALGLAPGSDVLEVAPGPGYHAIELARLGHTVTGLDISRTMVEIATEEASGAGVPVTFRQGDATSMPFPDASFDFVICQAAFKNFLDPVRALGEMHRVLRPGGVAVIQDMNGAATGQDIAAEVAGMGLTSINAAMTRVALTGLRRRALAVTEFERLARESAFGGSATRTEGLLLEVRLLA